MTNSTTVDYQAVPAPVEPPKASPLLLGQLSFMMFLEFAIQGAWLPLLFPFFKHHRNFPDAQVGYLGAIGAIGAIASPLVAGQLADRKMNAERVLGISHFLGALLVFRMAYATNFTELMIEAFLYGLLYTPTLALVNAISFRHLPDRDRDFGKVRVWGTIGWIAIGIAVGQWLFRKAGTNVPLQHEYMGDAFRISAFIGLFFGVYSFFLPKTPPEVVTEKSRGPAADPREPGGRTLDYAPAPKSKFAPGEAMAEIARQRPLLVLFILAFPIATVHSLFFARAAEYLGSGRVQLPNPEFINNIFGVGGAGLMTIGQMSEVLVLALMPIFAKRFSKKVLLTVGLLAYALRFFAFAYLPYGWAILPALALHGLVFGCFFFLVFMIIDEHTTKDVTASAQNLFNFIIFGVGVIAGNTLAGWIGEASTTDGQMNWTRFMSIPMWITLACLIGFWIFYPNRSRIPNKEGLAAA